MKEKKFIKVMIEHVLVSWGEDYVMVEKLKEK